MHVVHRCTKKKAEPVSQWKSGSSGPSLLGKREWTCSVLELKYDECLKPFLHWWIRLYIDRSCCKYKAQVLFHSFRKSKCNWFAFAQTRQSTFSTFVLKLIKIYVALALRVHDTYVCSFCIKKLFVFALLLRRMIFCRTYSGVVFFLFNCLLNS